MLQSFRQKLNTVVSVGFYTLLHTLEAAVAIVSALFFDFIRKYVKLFSEPVPKQKLQMVHSVKPRLDQLYQNFPEKFVPTPESLYKYLL